MEVIYILHNKIKIQQSDHDMKQVHIMAISYQK